MLKVNIKKILVDMDGILNDFSPYFEYYAKTMYKYELDTAGRFDWQLLNYFYPIVSKKKAKKYIDTIMHDEIFWKTLPVKEDSQSILKKVCDRYEVYIATTPWESFSACRGLKIEWLEKYFPFIKRDNIIFSKEKWLLDGDVLIDDRPTTIDKFGRITILIDYPYNKACTPTYRVNSWKEIGDILLS